jgi:cardiolipin synthase
MFTVVITLAFLLTVGVLISFLARGTPVREVRVIGEAEVAADIGTAEFRDACQVLSATPLAPTHRLELLCNGDELFDRLFGDLQAASRLITFHVFWFRGGRIADRVHDVLTERARAGVKTLVLFDYYGTDGLSGGYIESLRQAGVQTAIFRPPRWNTLYKAQHRMHVRSVVIDGQVGYTGGFGIDDRWMGDGRHRLEWRDTNVRVQGSAVAQLQGSFAANWGEATGELIVGGDVFPFGLAAAGGTQRAGIMFSAPSYGSTNAERFFILSLAGARTRWWLTSAYFIPNRSLRGLMCKAVERGVDVRVLTPGANTDRASTWYAGRSSYEELLERGVRIYEYLPTMMHAKTLVVDGVWSAVGSMNLDNRSLVLNDEVALVAWDETLGEQLEQVFIEDLDHAKEVELDRFRARGWPGKAAERVANGVSRIL